MLERLNREIRRCTWVVGIFPDGESALMLVCARLRHVAGTQRGNKKYTKYGTVSKIILLYFAPQFSVYTEFGIDPVA